jgi:hypothetical protein
VAERRTTKRATKPAGKSGRPSLLTADLIEHIAAQIRRGRYIDAAASDSGIGVRTVRAWKQQGTDLQARLDNPNDPLTETTITEDEQLRVRFLHAVDTAKSAWLATAMDTHADLCLGGRQVETVTTVTDPKGQETVTRKVETLAPNLAGLQWRMERMFPDLLGRRTVDVNVGGQVDNPVRHEVAISADALLAKLRAVDDPES